MYRTSGHGSLCSTLKVISQIFQYSHNSSEGNLTLVKVADSCSKILILYHFYMCVRLNDIKMLRQLRVHALI